MPLTRNLSDDVNYFSTHSAFDYYYLKKKKEYWKTDKCGICCSVQISRKCRGKKTSVHGTSLKF